MTKAAANLAAIVCRSKGKSLILGPKEVLVVVLAAVKDSLLVSSFSFAVSAVLATMGIGRNIQKFYY